MTVGYRETKPSCLHVKVWVFLASLPESGRAQPRPAKLIYLGAEGNGQAGQYSVLTQFLPLREYGNTTLPAL